MFVLVTYDVSTTDGAGKKRLRKVAGICKDYGVRVQNSVFECVVNAAEYRELKHKLIRAIDEKQDSLRFYSLGDKYQTKVEHVGAKPAIKIEEPLIF